MSKYFGKTLFSALLSYLFHNLLPGIQGGICLTVGSWVLVLGSLRDDPKPWERAVTPDAGGLLGTGIYDIAISGLIGATKPLSHPAALLCKQTTH